MNHDTLEINDKHDIAGQRAGNGRETMIDVAPQTTQFQQLKSISVIGGFLDGMEIEFAEGLNCLIGHRGAGKTTILEFVRYALDAFPNGPEGQVFRKRVEALVRSNLGDGRIRLTIQTKDGLEYTVDRTSSGEAMVLTADGQPSDVRINYAGLFSIDIFSQNEVENIADSPQSQLELIDNFAADEIAELTRDIARVRGELDANATAIVPAQEQLDALADDLSTLPAVEAKIAALSKSTGDEKTDEVNTAHQHRALRGREQQAIIEATALAQQYAQHLRDSVGHFGQKASAIFCEDLLAGANGQVLKAILSQLQELGGQLDQVFGRAADVVDSRQRTVAGLAGQLHQAHQQQELAFRDLIAKHNQARGVATERAEWERKRNDLLAKRRRHAALREDLDALRGQRRELTKQLGVLWDRRYAARKRVATWITERVSSPIRVEVDQFGDATEYRAMLAAWLKGTVGQYNVCARKIAGFIPPTDLARIVLDQDTETLQRAAELSAAQARKAMEALSRMDVQLQLGVIDLADLPRIELQDGSEWKNSLRLSTGQKCTTILPILLLESENPLLVDQPEDNLDNRFIYDTVVDAINRVKTRRQIVLITHNPNIPVLGEAAQVYVLTSDGERAELANTGSVDDCKTEIIDLLEGGKEAFARRRERYDD